MKNKNNYCPICKKAKKNENNFCETHEKAKKALLEGYEHWLRAYGALSWEAYLKELSALDKTVGKAIKEIIHYEKKKIVLRF